MSSRINRFAAIAKVADQDDGTVVVFGVASTEAVDAHGEIVTKAAMENALPDFFKYGTGALRAMHQPIAAGVVTKATINAAGETEIEAHVVDPVEVAKVKAGVYKGFSIGGSKLPGGYDAVTKTISAMKLTEISLVDRPANPDSIITMFKLEDEPGEAVVKVAPTHGDAAQVLADMVNKGLISPERLVELAQPDVAAAVAKGRAPPFVKDDEKDDKAAAAKEGDDEETDDDKKKKKVPPAFLKDKDDEKAEKADVVVIGADGIAKSMYDVSRFAELIQSVGYLVCDAKWSAEHRGDGSAVPEKLADWLTAGTLIFKEMAAEEVSAFIAQYTPASATGATIRLSDEATTLQKSLDAAAATGSLGGYLAIAKAHMPENEVAAVVLSESFEKATAAVLARLVPDNETIAKLADATAAIGKLETERTELIAKVAALESQPIAPKGVLRVVVEKGVDIATTDPVVASGPVLKTDGSIDHEATAMAEIKKMHQSGGQMLRFHN